MTLKKRKTKTSGDGETVSSSGISRASNVTDKDSATPSSRMYNLFGFDWSDVSSWDRLVKLLNRPSDPSNLAAFRFMFGLLMVIDIPQERGLAHADYRWGDTDECHFPLFDFLKPLPLKWMYAVYLVMLSGAVGIMVGLFFRLSCMLFITSYWYVFLLDKVSWNNHSYLYGLIGIMLFFSDANRYGSIDALLSPKLRNSHVPLRNYTLFRFQFFLVYFYAGLKKLDADWVTGYSMNELSKHWVFMPFGLLMTPDQIDLIVVHWGGLTLDLTMGYLLFFDKTRPIGLFFGTSFHVMNSQLFSIGMFPYGMIAGNCLFFSQSWPKKLFSRLPSCLSRYLPSQDLECQDSPHCIYSKYVVKQEDRDSSKGAKKTTTAKSSSGSYPNTDAGLYHKCMVLWMLGYIGVQLTLPYSHFITKGYNNWTNGLYGYSWDMMVHSWATQHIRLTYVNKDTGELGYLNPQAWSGSRKRWSSHADMLKQYSNCVRDQLTQHNITNVALYFDIWRSLNDRFQQRMFDPGVDILMAPWSAFQVTPWLMPLLTDLSDWRSRLDQIERNLYNSTNDTDVVFIADFPGLTLENYIQEELDNTTLTVLKGEIIVELLDQETNITLKEEDVISIPSGEYHNVHTISSTPSCYMYIFLNTTERDLEANLTEYQALRAKQAEHKDLTGDMDPADYDISIDPNKAAMYDDILQQQKQTNHTPISVISAFVWDKFTIFRRSVMMTSIALKSIIKGQTFDEVFNTTFSMEGGEADQIASWYYD